MGLLFQYAGSISHGFLDADSTDCLKSHDHAKPRNQLKLFFHNRVNDVLRPQTKSWKTQYATSYFLYLGALSFFNINLPTHLK